MRKLLIIAAIVAAALFAQSPAFSQDEAAKPAYKNGDTWLFTSKDSGTVGSDLSKMLNGTYEVSIVDGKIKTASITGSQKDDLDPRPGTLGGRFVFYPAGGFTARGLLT